MSWIIGILGFLAAAVWAFYQAGPGINNRRERRKNAEWMKKWRDLNKGK